jgi:hypothetical protein
MYFFIEACRNLQATAALLEVELNEIYLSVAEKFYAKYSLPALGDFGDGFTQYDASDEEIEDLIQRLKKEEGVKLSYDFGDYEMNPLEDGGSTPLMSWLDQQFIEAYEAAANEAFLNCEKVKNNEIKDEEIEGGNYVEVFSSDSNSAGIAAQKFLEEKENNDEYFTKNAYEVSPYLYRVRFCYCT